MPDTKSKLNAPYCTAILFRLFLSAALFTAALLYNQPAYAQTDEGSLIDSIAPDAAAVLYVSDIGDFSNYSKWSPIYDYIISEEFGGIYITEKGKSILEKIENAIKMPLTDLTGLIKKEAVIFFDIGNFNDRPFGFAAAFKPADINKLRSIIEDNFIKAAPEVKTEKLAHGDFSYYFDFKFKNPFAAAADDKTRVKNAAGEHIQGRFAVALLGGTALFCSSKEYLQKITEYSPTAESAKPPFNAHLGECRKDLKTGVFINLEVIIAQGLKSLKENIETLKNSPDKPGKNSRSGGGGAAQKASELEILSGALETLGVRQLKNMTASHEITETGLVAEGELDYGGENAIVKFAGPDIDYLVPAKLCPADASSLAIASINFMAIIEAFDAISEKMPISARAQYFMAKSAVLSATGMKLKEDIFGMLSGELIIINKIAKNKVSKLWTSMPTIIIKLKNPKTADMLISKLTEQKLMANFEVKEYSGRKYFSAPIPGADKQFLCLAVAGDYFIFSLSFDHFTSVMRNITGPQNSITGLKKFNDSLAGIEKKAFYFIYTSDDDMAEYYIENNYLNTSPIDGHGEFIARYGMNKINWEKVKRRQAPTAGVIYKSGNSFKTKVIGGFKRE
jgi:hypothetical protein